ncbi:hypothetical protein Pfo_019682 [Paulownia fortunei]|nr:hypothetical protein Pfo_019682 [Paulownia fortunei]
MSHETPRLNFTDCFSLHMKFVRRTWGAGRTMKWVRQLLQVERRGQPCIKLVVVAASWLEAMQARETVITEGIMDSVWKTVILAALCVKLIQTIMVLRSKTDDSYAMVIKLLFPCNGRTGPLCTSDHENGGNRCRMQTGICEVHNMAGW